MAETQIEWTDATFHPVAGCTFVTAGCTNCYAMEMAKRLEAMGIAKHAGLTRRSGKHAVWRGAVTLPPIREGLRNSGFSDVADPR